MRITLKNQNNAPIGWLEDSGSQIKAFHIRKGLVGYYNKSSDMTFTVSGSVFCYGDGAQCLVRDADK